MADKILTISIAAYNVSEYLVKCVESLNVSNNDVSDAIEIIIVDDGSKDMTSQIADQLAEKMNNVKVIHKTNGGYGSTINESLKISTGKYFRQLDGDDWLETKNICQFIEQLRKTDSNLILTPYYKFYEQNSKQELIRNHSEISEKLTLDSYKFKNTIAMHELTISTAFARKIGLHITENCFYTDNEFVLIPYILADTISYIDLPIYNYRIGREGQSVSLSGAQKHYDDIRRVAENLLHKIMQEQSSECTENKKSFINDKMYNLLTSVYCYNLAKGTKEAKKELIMFNSNLERDYHYFYILSDKSKIVKCLRKSKFLAYDLLAKYVVSKWR